LLLRAENLSRRFGGVSALEAVDLTLARGTVHAVIGPNGAGKTTLLNLLSGIYRPHTGRIVFDDVDVTSHALHEFAAAGIGRTFQNLQIFFNMTALENVMAGRWLCNRSSLACALLRFPSFGKVEQECRAAAEALMEDVGLARWLGALMMLTMILMPRGLVPTLQKAFDAARRQPR